MIPFPHDLIDILFSISRRLLYAPAALSALTMSLQSDVTIDASKFHPDAIPASAHALNNHLMEIMKNGPKWYEVFRSLIPLPIYPKQP